ncbi:uncharacterized protein LOC144910253 isoform X2 [Branchiostoma floridae x Branchiostoma belcheri]
MNPSVSPEGENWWCQPKRSSPNIQEGPSSSSSSSYNQNHYTPTEPDLREPPSQGVPGEVTPKLGLTDSQLLWLRDTMSRGRESSPPSVSLSTHSPPAVTAAPAAETDAPPAHMKGMLAAREYLLQQLGVGRGSLKKPSGDFSTPGGPVAPTTQSVQARKSHVPGQAGNFHVPGQAGTFPVPGQVGNFPVPGMAGNFHVPEQARKFHVPDQARKSHVPDQARKSHVPEQAGKSHVPRQAGKSHVPEQAGKSHVPGQAGKSHVPGQAGKSHVPEQAGKSHVPEQARKSHVPGQAGKSHVPGQAGKSHVPGQAGKSHVPGQARNTHVPDQAEKCHIPEHTSISTQADGSESNIYAAYVESMYEGLAAAGGYAYPLNDRVQKPNQSSKDRGRQRQTPPKEHNGQVKDNCKTGEKPLHDRLGVKILGMESYQSYLEKTVEEEPKKWRQIPWSEIKRNTDHVPQTAASPVSRGDMREEQKSSKQGMGEGTSQGSKYVPKEKEGAHVGRQNSSCVSMNGQGNRQWKKTPTKEPPPVGSVAENRAAEQAQLGPRKDRVSSKPGSRRNSMSEDLSVIKAEYDWRRFQLERKFKKVLDALKEKEEQVAAKDLWTIVKSEGGRLAEFPMPGAEAVLLDLLLTRAVEKKETRLMTVKLLAVLCLYQKSMDVLSSVLLEKQASYCKVSGATNAKRLYEGYSETLGHLYLQSRNNSGQEFQDCICDMMLKTLEKWLHINTQDQGVLEVCTNCLCSLLTVVGSELDSSARELMQLHFSTIKIKILDDSLPREVRRSLLELALLRAGSWVQETSSQENGEDIASEGAEAVPLSNGAGENRTATDSKQPPLTMNGDVSGVSSSQEEEKDRYKTVRAMLTDLCLEEFLPKFQENGIRDATLRANRGELKTVLKESGFVPGTILEIMLYLDTHGVGANTGQHTGTTSCKTNIKEEQHRKSTWPTTPGLEMAAQHSLCAAKPSRPVLERPEALGSHLDALRVTQSDDKLHNNVSRNSNYDCKEQPHTEPKPAWKVPAEQSQTVSTMSGTSIQDSKATKANGNREQHEALQQILPKNTPDSSVSSTDSKDDGRYAAKTFPLPCPRSLPLPPPAFFQFVPGNEVGRESGNSRLYF